MHTIKNIVKSLSVLFGGKDKKKQNTKREGHWKEYSKQGVLIREGNYRNGLKTGKWKLYYDTGEIAIEETYSNGVKEGPFMSYYKEGQVISEGQYSNNLREGRFNIFDHTGLVTKSMFFRSDQLVNEETFQVKPGRVLQEA
jgi:uncharacterized protein